MRCAAQAGRGVLPALAPGTGPGICRATHPACFIGRQHRGNGVVLKLTPDRAIANEEALALRAWAATPHAVDLLDAGALLLEKIEPGTKVSDEPELPPASEVAELLIGLRGTTSYDGGRLPTLAQGVESLFARIGGLLSDPRVSPLVAPHLVAQGHRIARELASSGPAGLLVPGHRRGHHHSAATPPSSGRHHAAPAATRNSQLAASS
jgi:hypothetical protein